MKTLEASLRIPDLWQQQAVGALRAGRDVVIHAPTGAGKTYVFELLYATLKGQTVFTVPTRALANDKFAEWRAAGSDVGIATGDLVLRPEARVIVATLETQRSRLLAGRGPRLLVIDEYQMLADDQRGANYELALALAPPGTQLLLLSGSVGNPGDIATWLRRLGREVELIVHADRPVPLEEHMLEAAPFVGGARAHGYWPPLLAQALGADLGPILVFAPRRAAAEDLARELASTLPIDDPLALTPEQTALAGSALAKLLHRRIAYHHSGLSYGARAGLIEPLAKMGQLRVVVATTGLAAGVNFSLRSVLVTDTKYSVRHFERHVAPDELLQMFGRAGRRGLDECGYVLVAPGHPRLGDARPKNLRRAPPVDWPSLLAVMGAAAFDPERTDTPPLAVAVETCRRLYSAQDVPLGAERSLADGPRACGLWVDAERSRLAQPVSREILGSVGEWEPRGEECAVPLAELWAQVKATAVLAPLNDPKAGGDVSLAATAVAQWLPALHHPGFMRAVAGGSLCRIRRGPSAHDPGGWRYGREFPIAVVIGADEVRLVKGVRASLRASDSGARTFQPPPSGRMNRKLFTQNVVPEIPRLCGGGGLWAVVERGQILIAQLDYSSGMHPAIRDAAGRALFAPPERRDYPACCRSCPQLSMCESGSRETTPALAWRQLGLIEADGSPTRRGVIGSFFQHGEGLAIAAALEQPDYPIAELLADLANLRAGPRFTPEGDNPHGGRLGAACQRVYGRADHPGYLEMGVPPDYGDGAAAAQADPAQAVRAAAERHGRLNALLRPGDVERAVNEWRSLISQIARAPEYPWDRWQALQAAARQRVAADPTTGRLPDFPPLTAAQQRRYQHRLFVKPAGGGRR